MVPSSAAPRHRRQPLPAPAPVIPPVVFCVFCPLFRGFGGFWGSFKGFGIFVIIWLLVNSVVRFFYVASCDPFRVFVVFLPYFEVLKVNALRFFPFS